VERRGAPSYSKVLDNLYIGDKRTAKDKDLLQSLGITYVVNVTKDIRNYFELPPFKYLKCPCDDTDVASLQMYFDKAVDFIEEGRADGHSVLVHCQQGVSRSVSIVLAYLIRTQGLSLKEAYTKVRLVRPEAKPKQNFLSQLFKYENRLTSSKRMEGPAERKEKRKIAPTTLPVGSKTKRIQGPSLPPSSRFSPDSIQEEERKAPDSSSSSASASPTTVSDTTDPPGLGLSPQTTVLSSSVTLKKSYGVTLPPASSPSSPDSFSTGSLPTKKKIYGPSFPPT